MRQVRLGLLFILSLPLFFSIIFAGTAFADSAPLDVRGNGLAPLQNDEVEMAAERVDIYPYAGWVYVDATFTLRNTGAETELLVGFPEEEESAKRIVPHPLIDFTAEIDGTPATIAIQSASPEQFKDGWRVIKWHTFTVSFDEGQTRMVRNTYFQKMGVSQIFHYILQTGAAWKGTIGTADIVIHPSGGYTLDALSVWHRQHDIVDWSIEPSDKAGEEKIIAWHFKEIEPGPTDTINMAPFAINRVPTRPEPGWFSLDQKVGGVSPGEVITYQVEASELGKVPKATHISFYAGRERKKLAELTPSWDDSGIKGELTVPDDLQATLGRTVEVWAELEPGDVKSASALLFLKDPLAGTASAGSPSATALCLVVMLLGLALTALGIVTSRVQQNPRN